jgi:hypothetical protein
MRSRDARATTAGLLLVAATATSLIATTLLGSLPDGSGFLATVALHQNRLLAAALFQLMAAFTSAAIAVTLYPVLRQHAAGMALGAVAFRLIEGVFYALSAAGTLILVRLSGQIMVGASAQASGDLVRDPALKVQIGRKVFTPDQRFLSADENMAVLAGFQRRHPYRSRLLATVLGWGDLRCYSAAREFVGSRPFVSLWPLGSAHQASGGEDDV